MRRTIGTLALTATLVVLLAVLGTLQYRWLGQVSDAERERLRAGMRARATELSAEFDRELTRAYLAFHVDVARFDADPAAALADAYARAQAASSLGGLIKAVFVVGTREPDSIDRLDTEARTLVTAEWPPAFDEWRRRTDHLAAGSLPPFVVADALDAAVPALVVPVPDIQRIQNDQRIAIATDRGRITRAIVVWLDKERLEKELVPALVARHFGTPEASEFVVAVVARDRPSAVIYTTAPEAVSTATADFATGMFDLRLDELGRAGTAPPPGIGAIHSKLAITIVRRANAPEGAHVMMTGGDAQGGWQVLVRPRSGSLDAIVARSRRRNLAIALGVLGLLAASLVVLVASGQRQHRLARQQMEFVAAVSHELRTPLAVIRSAAENLADGLVSEGPQVRSYGALIESEGRRLTDMVERVMTFAGLGSTIVARRGAPVDVAALVRAAAGRLAADGAERGVNVIVPPELPALIVDGDADALRSAIENVLGNAIKYSPPGGSVDVGLSSDRGRVRISIVDRGIGIDRDEVHHIFRPFFRGRRAVDAQIRGAGIGLSIVRRVVEAHAGDVMVESEPGRGTHVTIALPLVPAA